LARNPGGHRSTFASNASALQAKRDFLIRDPAIGGWLRTACNTLGCELPLVAAPQQLRLLASNVQAHPSVSGALMISASVRNDAIFAQPFPVLTVTLSDAQGQRLAMRRLQPREYLDDTTILEHGLAPGASAALLLEVEDPGDKAVALEFGFEYHIKFFASTGRLTPSRKKSSHARHTPRTTTSKLRHQIINAAANAAVAPSVRGSTCECCQIAHHRGRETDLVTGHHFAGRQPAR
jgi:hypothetical protein